MNNNLLILLVLLITQSCSEAPPVDPTLEKIEKVENSLSTPVHIDGDTKWTIEERMEHYGVPGVSIAVINDGKIEWTKTYGVMDRESQAPVTKETLFQAASISKPVTAYAALSLVEQNKIELEEDINTYLKTWKLPDNEFTEEKKVNVQNLLSHTAGVTVHGFLGYSPGLPVPTLVEVLNGTDPANSGAIFVDKMPEESFRYSGGGYNIVQQMMIDVEGNTFPEIMKNLVLQPLEMNNSTYDQPLPDKQLAMAATGYLPDGTMTTGKRHTYPEMAPAGLWTTAEDLAKFAVNIQSAMKGESEVGLSKDMTTQMLTPFVEDFIGLGIFLRNIKDEVYFGHGGWNEGFSSELMAHSQKGYGVVVMTNSNHPDFISELIRSVALTYEWDDFVPTYERKGNIDETMIAEISGRYLIDGNDVLEVYQDEGLLYSKGLQAETKELIKNSDTTFVRRERLSLMMFKPDAETESMNLIYINPDDGEIIRTLTKMNVGEKIPLEYLLEGKFEESLAAYQTLKEEDPNDPTINENTLNVLGYNFLGDGEMKHAQEIFKVNMILYPKSSNVYDSYAEACMELGETELAIEYYEKSISLDPENQHARNMIDKMQSGE